MRVSWSVEWSRVDSVQIALVAESVSQLPIHLYAFGFRLLDGLWLSLDTSIHPVNVLLRPQSSGSI